MLINLIITLKMKTHLVNLKIILSLLLLYTTSCKKNKEKPLSLIDTQWEFTDLDNSVFNLKFLSESEFVVTYNKAIDTNKEEISGQYFITDSIITLKGNNRIEKEIVCKDRILFYDNQVFVKKTIKNLAYNIVNKILTTTNV